MLYVPEVLAKDSLLQTQQVRHNDMHLVLLERSASESIHSVGGVAGGNVLEQKESGVTAAPFVTLLSQPFWRPLGAAAWFQLHVAHLSGKEARIKVILCQLARSNRTFQDVSSGRAFVSPNYQEAKHQATQPAAKSGFVQSPLCSWKLPWHGSIWRVFCMHFVAVPALRGDSHKEAFSECCVQSRHSQMGCLFI